METPTLDYSKKTVKEQEQPSPFSCILGIFKKKDEENAKIEYGEYVKLKAAVKEYPKYIKMLTVFYIVCFLICLFMVWARFSIISSSILFGFLGILAIIFLILFAEICKRHQHLSDMSEQIYEYDLSYAQQSAEEDPFQNSIKTSYKYLDLYYDQTQRQAQQGFHITVFIAVFGALLIFGGVAAMYFGFIQPAYITCASGAITELISAIFFYLYNKTVTSMSRYHNKLVLSQNIAFALRIAGEMDGIGEKTRRNLRLSTSLSGT